MQKALRSTQKTNPKGVKTKEKEGDGQAQGTLRELSKHSLDSPDLMRSIRNLHLQQRQICLQTEISNQNEAQ